MWRPSIQHVCNPSSSVLRLQRLHFTSSSTLILREEKLSNYHHGVHGGDLGPGGPASRPCGRFESHKRGSHQDRKCGEAFTRPSSVYTHQKRSFRPTTNPSNCTSEAAEAMVLPLCRKTHQQCASTIHQLRVSRSRPTVSPVPAAVVQHFPSRCPVFWSSTLCEHTSTEFDRRCYATHSRWLWHGWW
jgi:hypothetical protein